MSKHDTFTQKHASKQDHESDPAHTPGDGWVDEGGASHLGPATHLDEVLVEHEHQNKTHTPASESAE